jgi:predicted metal-dependent phosphoesterase TrpH
MLEVMNARVLKKVENEYAEQFAKHIGKPAVAGSDAHIAYEIGRAVVEIESVADAQANRAALPRATWSGSVSPAWVHGFSTLAKWQKRLTGQYDK